jgi:hypothetical protein
LTMTHDETSLLAAGASGLQGNGSPWGRSEQLFGIDFGTAGDSLRSGSPGVSPGLHNPPGEASCIAPRPKKRGFCSMRAGAREPLGLSALGARRAPARIAQTPRFLSRVATLLGRDFVIFSDGGARRPGIVHARTDRGGGIA